MVRWFILLYALSVSKKTAIAFKFQFKHSVYVYLDFYPFNVDFNAFARVFNNYSVLFGFRLILISEVYLLAIFYSCFNIQINWIQSNSAISQVFGFAVFCILLDIVYCAYSPRTLPATSFYSQSISGICVHRLLPICDLLFVCVMRAMCDVCALVRYACMVRLCVRVVVCNSPQRLCI